MKTLIIAEHQHTALKLATYHVAQAAQALDKNYDVLVTGFQCEEAAKQASLLPGAQQVLCADHEVYQHQLAENNAALIAEIARGYQYILIASTTFGKDVLPRAAALLNHAMISDVTRIISVDTFTRPLYAGNVMATVQSFEEKKFLSIRTTAFPAVQALATSDAVIKKIDTVIPLTATRFEGQTLTPSVRPELTSARIIISGGRGLKSAENFKLLEGIADRLGAAIGASRAAVDAGFAPNDYQVGQTGKIVAPDLYIAVGISGAIQHLAGMKDSKVIVAINQDPEAPIFQAADYILVGDLFKILPQLQEVLDNVLK